MSYQPTEPEIRHRRDRFLQKSDLYVLPDRWDVYTPEEKAEWSAFRQALRDLPSQVDYPTQIIWPTSPVDLNIEKPEGWPDEWP